MNMQKLGTVLPAGGLCYSAINFNIYNKLKVMFYTLCEAQEASGRNRNRNGFGFNVCQIIDRITCVLECARGAHCVLRFRLMV